MIFFLVVSDGLCVSYVFFKERFALKVIPLLCWWSEGSWTSGTIRRGEGSAQVMVFLGTAIHHVLNDLF